MAVKKKVEFSDIPTEIDILIAEHLEPTDLISLMQTARPLAQLLASERDRKAMRYNSNFVGSILHWAVGRGEKNLAERVLKRGLSVDSGVNAYGQTPLHIAARDGQADFTELFLNCGADTEARDHDSETPLWLAARYKNLAVVKILLEKGANAAARRQRPRPVTILHATIENFSNLPRQEKMQLGPIIYHLLNTSSDPSRRSVPDRTTMWLAFKECCAAAIPILLEAGAEFPLPKENMVHINMDHAIRQNSKSMIKYFLQELLNKDLQALNFSAILPYAAQQARLSTLQFLVDFVPETFQTQEIRDNCLYHAVVGHKIETVEFLLSVGANPSALLPLHRALFIKDKGHVARILINAGSDLNAKDPYGRSPLSLAVVSGCKTAGMVQVLIDAGANVLETDGIGQTLLHKAVTAATRSKSLVEKGDETNLFTTVELLLQHGVDINKRNDNGFTALHYAIPVWPRSVLEFLVRSGADPAIKPNEQPLLDLLKDWPNSLKPVQKSEVLEYVTELEGRN